MSGEFVLKPLTPPQQQQIDYARELNEQQYQAVTAPPGPSLVLAGAGSGKTRTLIYRVAWLLEQGIPAERILLLTFTNKAAREMMRRVSDLLGQELPSLWGGTFHSIGNRILRTHAALLGYRRDFAILDREDSRHLITTCLAESGIDREALHFPKPEVLGEIFSLAINTHQSIHRVLETQYPYFAAVSGEIEDVRRRYFARKTATNAMDFDDLLALWLQLLREREEVREHYQRRFQFILVDEYQDTNQLQSDLIDLLAERHHNVMVVGDDAQSIYAWRGANYENILQFSERYPETKIYKIEMNYRSTPEILHVANASILPNAKQFPKNLGPARKAGSKPVLVTCMDAREQATFVCRQVLQLREEGTSLNGMVVLYRSHFHALELQLELTKRHIPYSITSGIRFFEQAHIKDVTAHLKLISNPRDELSFKRLAQLLPGIGKKGADKLWKAYLPDNDARLGETNPLATALQACASSVPKKSAAPWAQFIATVAQLEAEGVRRDPSKMIDLVIEAGYEEHLQENYANYRSRLEDLHQLAGFARDFSNVEDFLTQLALLTNVEAEEEQPAGTSDEQLRLSTIHQAKGLEFDVVFVIMLSEGLFPSEQALTTPDGLEEERRLLYVAVTRARNELYLTYPLIRAGFGGSGEMGRNRSRFLDEIPRELFEDWDLSAYR